MAKKIQKYNDRNTPKSGDKNKILAEVMHNKNNSHDDNYLFNMSAAPSLNEDTHWFTLTPVIFFTAFVIMITRMYSYQRPVDQFFWGGHSNNLVDFFSYYKLVAIMICAALVLLIILYKIVTQSFYIKRSFVYIPMLIYIVFVLLSYMASEYKTFALWGYVDRFEGTIALICYMILLFFTINTVNTEKNVKYVVYPLAVTSFILGLIGLSQALGHDFFQTSFGKKLITPSSYWNDLDKLEFTFQNKEIYQTVYNINYVSFYLTLLIPLFALLFINSVMRGKTEPLWKKIIWGALFSLSIYNLIGSVSSGGILGMAVVILVALIVLNKRLIDWKKPVIILLVISIAVVGTCYDRLLPEVSNAVNSVLGIHKAAITPNVPSGEPNSSPGAVTTAPMEGHTLDYMVTSGDAIIVGTNNGEISFITYPDDPSSITVKDEKGDSIQLIPTSANPPTYQVSDKRFDFISLKPAVDESNNNYLILITGGTEWPFRLTEGGPMYFTLGNTVSLHKVPAIGWKNNQTFGSGRGYIWSRTIPMMKDTLILGHGADTYCIYFPQEDYVGKYNSGTFTTVRDIIVDKPHNMYFGAIIGTGGISVLALLALWGIYLIQSFLLYRRLRYTNFISYVGAGIFFGISGFLVSGFVDDSSVSVMPLFYGLLGTGIAINMKLKNELPKKNIAEDTSSI